MKSRKWHIFTGGMLVLILFAGLGGIFGGSVLATGAAQTGVPDAGAGLHGFTSLLGAIEENSATPVDSNNAMEGAIDGMLRTLDPHSRFFNPKEYKAAREDQTGKYYGLGVVISSRFGQVIVVSPPYPDSPAEKAGLRVGDQIAFINGKAPGGLDIGAIVSQLKGPRGTSVELTILRPGVENPVQLSIVRGEIIKNTINNAYRIRPGIGYIRLEAFAETSGDEMLEALKKIDSKNMAGLILDLRGNPGGIVNAAIQIGETFLQKGQVILETRGRAGGRTANRPYASQHVNTDNTYPMVVLIDQGSASAAEIVSGAIQDHDRGLLVGETSFGKGLVQSIYNLSKGGGLELVTLKWYTPSGRLIQRDYSQISEFDYLYHRDNIEQKPKTDIQHSDLGRVVYGGGGITPDHAVAGEKLTEFQDLLRNKKLAFYTFVRDFLSRNPVIDPSFRVSEAMVNDFKQHIQKRGISFTEADFSANRDFIKTMILYEVFYNRLGAVAAERVLLEIDPQVLKALDYLPEAKELQTRALALLAQKRE